MKSNWELKKTDSTIPLHYFSIFQLIPTVLESLKFRIQFNNKMKIKKKSVLPVHIYKVINENKKKKKNGAIIRTNCFSIKY